jgi:cardiolipin synthase
MADSFFALTLIIIYILGFFCASIALLTSRTPQGATAWVVGLITIPFVTIPMFLVFGRSRFYGYTKRFKSIEMKMNERFVSMKGLLDDYEKIDLKDIFSSLNPIMSPCFTSSNSIKLLKDAELTYQLMLEDLEKAKSYIIFQFYVFRPDATGWRFAEVLMRKAKAGVKVYFLYDEIGSGIPSEFLEELISTGIEVCHFNSLSLKGRLQINFRNHRKILIVDGKMAYVGGLNIGDDYLGLWQDLGEWRDTHIRLEGPSVLICQLAHVKDWFWCQKKELNLDWGVLPSEQNASVMVIPSGPADEKQLCLLSHICMINSAKSRLWIANPYLVPPDSLLDAILLAALRGVDVKFLVPSYSDAWIVMIASQIYIKKLLQHGVKVYRYNKGFLHEKVILVDNLFAVVGSANFDFRSMFINFEITVVASEEKFIDDVEEMLIDDIRFSEEIQLSEFVNESIWKKITSRAANLLAPIL